MSDHGEKSPFGSLSVVDRPASSWSGVAVYLCGNPDTLKIAFQKLGSPNNVRDVAEQVMLRVKSRTEKNFKKIEELSRDYVWKSVLEREARSRWSERPSKNSKSLWEASRRVSDCARDDLMKAGEIFLSAANSTLVSELRAEFGSCFYDLWDVGNAPLNWIADISVPGAPLDIRLGYSVDTFVFPLTSVAEALDFYSHNRSYLRSLVYRTSRTTIWGERNSREIIAALSKATDKQPSNTWAWPEMLLALVDAELSEPQSSDGTKFEQQCLQILLGGGVEATLTPPGPDKGVDILAENEGLRFAIQCKAFGRPVGIKAVQEAFAGARFYRSDFAMVVSDSGYTAAAEELASETKVVLTSSGSLLVIMRAH